MAQIYYNGEGVVKNNTIAKYWAWLEFANMDDNEKANSILNLLIEESDVADGNRIVHKKIIEDAAKAGERDALNNWASGVHRSGNKEEAVKLWKQAADMGHPLAICNLARQLWTEDKKEYEQAKELFEKSAALKYEGAYYGLAVMYYQGLGVEKDIKKVWSYLERSLNFGNNDARYLFATMCLNNELQGVIPDIYGRGFHYMELAAQQGYEPAIEFFKQQNGE
jgi:TPR repeat protein